jgi:hypothetical protein
MSFVKVGHGKDKVTLGRGHTKETGNRNFREMSPISSRQPVSRLAGAH